MSFNEETRQVEYKPVVQTFVNYSSEILSVYVEGESKPIETTPGHPFYAHRARDSLSNGEDDEGEWIEAGELRVGDNVRLANGAWTRILKVERRVDGAVVYNFEVADNHNYFVGSLGLLVHNTCPNPDGILGKASTRQQIYDIATELESRGWTITGGGGRLPEEYLRGVGPGRKGSSLADITATKNGRTLRINTIDTRADKITPTTREANNAARIRRQRPGDHLLLIPKL